MKTKQNSKRKIGKKRYEIEKDERWKGKLIPKGTEI